MGFTKKETLKTVRLIRDTECNYEKTEELKGKVAEKKTAAEDKRKRILFESCVTASSQHYPTLYCKAILNSGLADSFFFSVGGTYVNASNLVP